MPAGVAELSVFYCENAAQLIAECGFEDEGYFAALIRMFEQAVLAVIALEPNEQQDMLTRLDAVRSITRNVGWGVSDVLNDIWADHTLSD